MTDYERDHAFAKPAGDYSVTARKILILDALKQAGRPLLASEIDLSQLCSKSLKEWTLRRLLKTGQICRVLNAEPGDERHIYRYFSPKAKIPKPNRSKNGNPNTRNVHGAK